MQKLLTIEEYVQKLSDVQKKRALMRIEEAFFRDKITPLKEQAYNRYSSLKGKCAFEKERISLSEEMGKRNPIFTLDRNTKGNYAEFWFMLFDLRTYLLKRVCSKGNSKRLLENTTVIPKIVRALGCESAEYYLTDYWNNYGEEDTFIVTPDFLEKDDELFGLEEICDLKANEMLELEQQLRKYFSLRHFDNEQIEVLIRDVIKQVFVSKFVGNTDENLRNQSIIVNGRNIRVSPMYDYDFCCENNKVGISKREVNGDSSIESFLKHYTQYPWFKEWVENTVIKLNPREVLKKTDNNPNKANFNLEFYIQYFEKKQQEIRNCMQVEQERD